MKQQCPNVRPPNFGQTMIAVPNGSSGAELLERVREVWSVVAAWGRSWDEGWTGDRHETTVALSELPSWFRSIWPNQPDFELHDWFSHLDDREWIWWSGACVGNWVKIDINAESLPNSLFALRLVVEWAGGSVIYQDMWVATDNEVCVGPNP